MSVAYGASGILGHGSLVALPLVFLAGAVAGLSPCCVALYPSAAAVCCGTGAFQGRRFTNSIALVFGVAKSVIHDFNANVAQILHHAHQQDSTWPEVVEFWNIPSFVTEVSIAVDGAILIGNWLLTVNKSVRAHPTLRSFGADHASPQQIVPHPCPKCVEV